MSSPDTDTESDTDKTGIFEDEEMQNTGVTIPKSLKHDVDRKIINCEADESHWICSSTSRSFIVGLLLKKWVDDEIEL
jgi:hypothetical protein